MSNVLIGIIGVILFIGLALAGALFLGPRFQESTNNSRASAAVQAVSQVANAANMYQVQEGKTYTGADAQGLVEGQYLKSIPSNPTGTGGGAIVVDAAGTKLVTMTLGQNNAAVCNAIAKQTGSAKADGTAPASATGTSGCYTDGTTYTAFAAI